MIHSTYCLAVAGKDDTYRSYEVHGDSVESLRNGFEAIGMPAHRQAEAQAIVREVLQANQVVNFRWYVPPATREVCCYWDTQKKNVLWVNAATVSILAEEEIDRPTRALTWSKQDGLIVGWLLPGAESGRGGGPRQSPIAEVTCPVTFIRQPAGRPCPDCEVVHHEYE